MNILSHCISRVLRRKQMANSNWDYLRRCNLQRHYFQRCRRNVKKPNRMCRNPTLAVAGLLPSPGERGWGEGTRMGFQKERGLLSEEKRWPVRKDTPGHSEKVPAQSMPRPHSILSLQTPAKTAHKQNANENPRAKEVWPKFLFTSFLGKEWVDRKNRIMVPSKDVHLLRNLSNRWIPAG